jgi:hypothetical protein
LQVPRSLPGPITTTIIIIITTTITAGKRRFSRCFAASRGWQPLCIFSLIAFRSTLKAC